MKFRRDLDRLKAAREAKLKRKEKILLERASSKPKKKKNK